MRTHEIENWALSVIDRVNAGQPNEDQRVELKAGWIDPYKAARRIAAHANSARGEPFLWLMGVDEKSGVTGVSMTDLASWYAQVESQFDGLAPEMIPVNVPAGGNTVVALFFGSERAPFVVKVEGTDRLEVPWRGSTSTRSARRDELLRVLSPLQRLPNIQILGAAVNVFEMGGLLNYRQIQVQMRLQVYALPASADSVVIPYHTCELMVGFPPDIPSVPIETLWMEAYGESSVTIACTSTEVVINGPGMFLIHAQSDYFKVKKAPETQAVATLKVRPAGAEQTISLEETVPYVPSLVTSFRPDKWKSGLLQKP